MAEEVRKVLVIDDEEIIRQCSKRTLGPAGYLVHTASSGMEGLSMLNETTYDLILVDMMMPELDGTEVVKHIKRIAPGTKIMVITGYSSAETVEMIKNIGVSCYLEKPYSPQTLLKSVELIMEGKEDCSAE